MPRNDDAQESNQRLALYQQLSSLLGPQFDGIVYAVNIPPINLPSPGQGNPVKALLEWADSPAGCGLNVVEQSLEQLLRKDALEQFTETVLPDRNSGAVQPSAPPSPTPITPAKVVISYKRDVDPDEPTALALVEALRQHHQVFVDQDMPVGTPWAERIHQEIAQADALIVLLSEQAVHSEMVHREVALAHDLGRKAGKPKILPVRLAYHAPFISPLDTYLSPLNWAMWDGPEDTSQLIAALEHALVGQNLPMDMDTQPSGLPPTAKIDSIPRPTPAAQMRRSSPAGNSATGVSPGSLESPEGTMDANSRLYVERSFDDLAVGAIRRQGETVVIKGPRQMGKSSLLARVMDTARHQGKQVAYLDFQEFEKSDLAHADDFFPVFCALLSDELALEDQVDAYWKNKLGNTQRCTRYVERYLLKTLDRPVVLAMDEVDRTFDAPFRSDLFSMLRSWHNKRATKAIWKNLDLVLVTSTEPYQLIEDLNQSPFNVGQVIELTDFTAAQVADLNQRHGSPLTDSDGRSLMNLVHGHPYLVRKALYLVASGQLSADELFNRACEDRGPFGDHLRYHLSRLHEQPELTDCFLRVVHHQECLDEGLFFRLRGAGLVRRRQNGTVVPRCELYAQYFQKRLPRRG